MAGGVYHSNADLQRGEATEFVHGWLTRELRKHALHSLYSVAALILLSIIAHILVYLLILWGVLAAYGQGGRFGGYRGGVRITEWAFLLPALVLAIMHPIYWIWGRKKGHVTKLASGTVRIIDEQFTPSALVETQETREAEGGNTLVNLLTIPAWLFGLALQHFWDAGALRAADPWPATRVLIFLYATARRISLHDLEAELNEPQLAAALRALQHIPGVLFTARGFPCVALNSDLRSDLERMLR